MNNKEESHDGKRCLRSSSSDFPTGTDPLHLVSDGRMNLIVVDIQPYQRPCPRDFFVAMSLTFANPDRRGLGMKVSTNIAF
jgi:hypothetical protein